MSDLKTVFTDDDGDGIYDDVHVVNVMDNSNYYPTNHTYSQKRHNYSTSSTGSNSSIFSTRTNVKIALIVLGVFLGIGILSKIGLFILALFM